MIIGAVGQQAANATGAHLGKGDFLLPWGEGGHALLTGLEFGATHFSLYFLPLAFQDRATSGHYAPIQILAICAFFEIVDFVCDIPKRPLQLVVLIQKQIELRTK
jgi:hypothetical protein